ncbi:unnamed protein product [Prorocentrum cordatum]|uniref:Superoxide dismutase copper/zinc binding domain-containing protein n=1 Tax=Prorocentrum cordatum TaxID=2364126 RepID=A0ABN9V8N4_9DINO|nr:unnamed protein product [Polarella glacialis]
MLRPRLLALAPGARALLLTVPTLVPYPGYDGELQGVSGTVHLVAALDDSTLQTLKWSLEGVDPSCTEGAGDGVPNACGIHVHTGGSCEVAEEVGGHLYSEEPDPWSSAAYSVSSGGATAGSLTIETGLTLSELTGRALVVHQLAGGGRIACGILFAAPSIPALDFSKYPVAGDPTYDGYDLARRAVSLAFVSEGTQLLSWELSGLDEKCSSGRDPDTKNSCGIHVHSGRCTQWPSDIGPHYYNMAQLAAADPWAEVSYTTDEAGFSRGFVQVSTGLSFRELPGRAVVWHNFDGDVHACATLDPCAGTLVAQGGEAVQGSRMGTFAITTHPLAPENDWRPVYANAEGQFLYYWKAYGDWRIGALHTTEDCGVQSGPGAAACPTEAAAWSAWTGAAWTYAHSITVTAPTILSVAAFDRYPGYEGALTVAGAVAITGDATQTLQWDLTGLDAACSSGAGASEENGCGIHVHTGESCADAGAHFFSADGYNASDPWADVAYVSDASGRSSSRLAVATGLRLWELAGRALVVHALAGGARVACAEVVAGPTASAASFSRYPGYAGPLSVEGTVSIARSDSESQVLAWDLTGVDGACAPGASAGVPNGCGIHVHVGSSCDTAEGVGGHLYSQGAGSSSDPWDEVAYVATDVANGSGASSGVASVGTGLSLPELVGRSLVVAVRWRAHRVRDLGGPRAWSGGARPLGGGGHGDLPVWRLAGAAAAGRVVGSPEPGPGAGAPAVTPSCRGRPFPPPEVWPRLGGAQEGGEDCLCAYGVCVCVRAVANAPAATARACFWSCAPLLLRPASTTRSLFELLRLRRQAC